MSTAPGPVMEIGEVKADDPGFVAAGEVVFLVMRGRCGETRLLGPPAEVFGRPELRVAQVVFRPTDYLGNACLCCGYRIEDPVDMVTCVRAMLVVALLHETCFKTWFVAQDKEQLPGYRFAVPETRLLRARPGDPRLSLQGVPGTHEAVEFAALVGIDYAAIVGMPAAGASEAGPMRGLRPVPEGPRERAATRRAREPATEAAGAATAAGQAGAGGDGAGEGAGEGAVPAPPLVGASGDLNIFLCPRCDHPNHIPFLETVSQVHQCGRCGGRFGVRVVPL